jgi:hypothetical protein
MVDKEALEDSRPQRSPDSADVLERTNAGFAERLTISPNDKHSNYEVQAALTTLKKAGA